MSFEYRPSVRGLLTNTHVDNWKCYANRRIYIPRATLELPNGIVEDLPRRRDVLEVAENAYTCSKYPDVRSDEKIGHYPRP